MAIVADLAGTDVPVALALDAEIAVAGRQALIHAGDLVAIQGAGPGLGRTMLAAQGATGAGAKQVAGEISARAGLGAAGCESKGTSADLIARGDVADRHRAVIGAVIAFQPRSQRVVIGITVGLSKGDGSQKGNHGDEFFNHKSYVFI